eukprot:403357415
MSQQKTLRKKRLESNDDEDDIFDYMTRRDKQSGIDNKLKLLKQFQLEYKGDKELSRKATVRPSKQQSFNNLLPLLTQHNSINQNSDINLQVLRSRNQQIDSNKGIFMTQPANQNQTDILLQKTNSYQTISNIKQSSSKSILNLQKIKRNDRDHFKLIDQNKRQKLINIQQKDKNKRQNTNQASHNPKKKQRYQTQVKVNKFDDDSQILQTIEEQVKNIENIAQKRMNDPENTQIRSVAGKRSLKKRTHLKFDCDSDESDEELPTMIRMGRPQITTKEYMKLFNQKDQLHGDREKAQSIAANIILPKDNSDYVNNPMFNKQKQLDKNLNLHLHDLFSISQIEEKTIMAMEQQSHQYDDQIFQENLKVQILNHRQLADKQEQMMNKNTSLHTEIEIDKSLQDQMQNNQSHKSLLSLAPNDISLEAPDKKSGFTNINQQKLNNQMSKFQLKLKEIVENKIQQEKENEAKKKKISESSRNIQNTSKNENNLSHIQILINNISNQTNNDCKSHLPKTASNLTRQVQNAPSIYLKKLFSDKVKEMNIFQKKKMIDDYDSNTLSTVRKKGETEYRVYMREKIKGGEEELIDKNLESAIKMPKTLKQQMESKFSIKQCELEPFLKVEKEVAQKFMTIKFKLKEDKQENLMDLNKKEFEKEIHKVEKQISEQEERKQQKYIQQKLSSRGKHKQSVQVISPQVISLFNSTLSQDNPESQKTFPSISVGKLESKTSRANVQSISLLQTINQQKPNHFNENQSLSAFEDPYQTKSINYNNFLNNKISGNIDYYEDTIQEQSPVTNVVKPNKKNENDLFKNMKRRSSNLLTQSKSVFKLMHKTAQEEKCLGIMDDSHSTLKTLNKLVKDKLFNQVKEVDYDTTEQDPNINVYQDNNQPRSKSQNPDINQNNKTTASVGLENINYLRCIRVNLITKWCSGAMKR